MAQDANVVFIGILYRLGKHPVYRQQQPKQLFPDGADYTAVVRQVQHILTAAMQSFCPDVPFVTEYLLADRWYKGLDDQPIDESGRSVPYKNKCMANHR